MAEGDSPTVARRRVRIALREAREAVGYTQNEVAEEMEWSLSKVIRIENGDVSIAPNDLKPLLSYLNVRDKDLVANLTALAKIARQRQRTAWYQKPEFREHLTPAMLRQIEYETEAVAIRYHQVFFVPGPLQVPRYTEANLASYDGEVDERQQHFRAEARRTRRDSLRARLESAENPLEIYALLDQSVFLREVGGPEVFAEQLRDLLELATTGHVRIRMIPFTFTAGLANNATYELLALNREGEEVLYRENGVMDEIVEDSDVTGRHRRRFEKIWSNAESEEDTIDFIRSRLTELQTANGLPASHGET